MFYQSEMHRKFFNAPTISEMCQRSFKIYGEPLKVTHYCLNMPQTFSIDESMSKMSYLQDG